MSKKALRKSVVLTLALAATATLGVAFGLSWKPLLERIHLGEAKRILGSWEADKERDGQHFHLRLRFSSQVSELWKVRIDSSWVLEKRLKQEGPVEASRRGQYEFVKTEGNEIQFVGDRQLPEELRDLTLHRFRLEEELLVALNANGNPHAVLRRAPVHER